MNFIPLPSLDTLKRLSTKTYNEVCSLILQLNRIQDNNFKFTRNYFRDSIQLGAEKVLAIGQLSAHFLNDVFALQRILLDTGI